MSSVDEPTTPQPEPQRSEQPQQPAPQAAVRAANITQLADALMKSHDATFKELAK